MHFSTICICLKQVWATASAEVLLKHMCSPADPEAAVHIAAHHMQLNVTQRATHSFSGLRHMLDMVS